MYSTNPAYQKVLDEIYSEYELNPGFKKFDDGSFNIRKNDIDILIEPYGTFKPGEPYTAQFGAIVHIPVSDLNVYTAHSEYGTKDYNPINVPTNTGYGDTPRFYWRATNKQLAFENKRGTYENLAYGQSINVPLDKNKVVQAIDTFTESIENAQNAYLYGLVDNYETAKEITDNWTKYYGNPLDRYKNNPAQISNDYLNQPMMKSDSILMLNVQNIKDAKVYTHVNDKLISTSLEKYLEVKDKHRIFIDNYLHCTSDLELAFQGHERAIPIKDIPLDELRECYYEEKLPSQVEPSHIDDKALSKLPDKSFTALVRYGDNSDNYFIAIRKDSDKLYTGDMMIETITEQSNQWNWKNADVILLSEPYTKFVPDNPYSKYGDWENHVKYTSEKASNLIQLITDGNYLIEK